MQAEITRTELIRSLSQHERQARDLPLNGLSVLCRERLCLLLEVMEVEAAQVLLRVDLSRAADRAGGQHEGAAERERGSGAQRPRGGRGRGVVVGL